MLKNAVPQSRNGWIYRLVQPVITIIWIAKLVKMAMVPRMVMVYG